MRLPLVIALLAALLASAMAANAEITLFTPEDNTHSSTKPQQFTFRVTEQPNNCTLNVNGNTVKTLQNANANQTTSTSHELADGTYNWSVTCHTSTGSTASSERRLVIDLTAPSVSLQKPADQARINTTKPTFTYVPSDINLKSCSLRVKVTENWMTLQQNLSVSEGKNNSFSAELIDGDYSWNIICIDNANNSGKPLFDRKLTIDTTPPRILSYTPFSVITENSATLTVTTDEDASCRYGRSDNLSFSGMMPFELTELRMHRQFLEGVSDGINTYYVKCTDMQNNEMAGQKVKLDVHLLATAEITLSETTPVKAGMLNVKVKTSRALIKPPQLSYSLDEGAAIQVALTGSGSEWEGTIIIGKEPQKRLAKFSFSGEDAYGYTGTIITKGKTFVIDTDVPAAIKNLRAEIKQGLPFLSWRSDEDDIERYEIYRSTKPGVTFADHYANATSMSFYDALAENKQTYYYAVSAVDAAGNAGEHSNEVFATAVLNHSPAAVAPEVKEEQKPLPPNLAAKVNAAIKGIEAMRFSAKEAKTQLDSLSGERKKVAEEIGLLKKAESTDSKLASIISGLEQLKAAYQTEQYTDAEITKADLEAKKAIASLPKNVEIESQTEFVQEVTKEDVAMAANEAANLLGINAENRDDYVKNNLKNVEKIKISTRVNALKIELSNGEAQKKTLFQKTLSYQGETPLEDAIVIEFLPKTVAESAKEISFLSSVPEILKDDPVLKWGFVKLGFDPQPIKYLIDREVSFTDAKDVKTVPLTELSLLTSQTKVTGFATYPVAKGSPAMFIIVLATLAALGYYYFRPVSQSRKKIRDPVSYELLTDINHKLSSVKMEIDDMLHPLVNKINTSLENNHAVSGLELAEKMVEIASKCLEDGQHAKAKAIYSTLTLIYQSLPKEQKAKISAQCIQLSRRLSNT